MTNKRESTQKTAELLFGYDAALDWLSKAKRERDRFLNTSVQKERTDHALNFAMTASHLEDWVFHLLVEGNHKDWPDHQTTKCFDKWIRDSSLAMRILADVNNAAKHRVLNTRGSNIDLAHIGGIVYQIDYLPIIDTFIDQISSFSEIMRVEKIKKNN